MAVLGKQQYFLLSGATGNQTSGTVDVSAFSPAYSPACQITITGTATVTIQQSLDMSNWTNMAVITASNTYVLDSRGLFYQFVISGYVSGTITIVIGPGFTVDGKMGGVRGPLSQSTGPQ